VKLEKGSGFRLFDGYVSFRTDDGRSSERAARVAWGLV
jgi:hypothetical protein